MQYTCCLRDSLSNLYFYICTVLIHNNWFTHTHKQLLLLAHTFINIVQCDIVCIASPALSLSVCTQCVFEVSEERGLLLVEVAEGVSVEDVRAATGASFQVITPLPPPPHTHTNRLLCCSDIL